MSETTVNSEVTTKTKLQSILDKHQLGQAEYCRLILEKTSHYCTYHNMNLLCRGRYNSSVSLTRARAFVDTLNQLFDTTYTIDDLFDR